MVRYGVLGPFLVVRGDQQVTVTSAKQRAVLAVLLLRANRVVLTDQLIDEVWGERPPSSARDLVATYIWRLRRLLDEHPGAGGRLRRVPGGYRLRVGDGELDIAEFDRLSARGQILLAAGDAVNAAAALRAALDLWRGEPLADVTLLGSMSSEALAMAEQRADALELRIDADLATGRHGTLVGELGQLVERYPARERFVGQLMTALYRSGRRSDALAAYQQVRARLVRDLGVDPGEELAALHQAVLREDPGLRTPGSRPAAHRNSLIRPDQLPGGDRGFRGRQAELAHLDALLAAHRASCDFSPLVVVITGSAGMGKTSLALHWAHRIHREFPDGRLFADLRGYSASGRKAPVAVLTWFLRSLGLSADQIPVRQDEAAAQYRTVLAGRQVLVVVDDVADAEAAAPLIPASCGSVVVLTSRSSLDELGVRHGAARVTLQPFSAPDSRALLAASMASGRRLASRTSADEMATLCGHLPLALRLAAAHLDEHPALAVDEYVTEVRRGDLIPAPDGPPGTARRTFDLSYRALAADDARAFRLLGLLAGPQVTGPAAAALLDRPEAATGQILDRLARAHLLDRDDAGRFTIHDMLRGYATERALADEPAGAREQARRRFLDWYLTAVMAADRILDPHRYRAPLDQAPLDQVTIATAPGQPPVFATQREAVAWLDAERGNLAAAVSEAAQDRPATAWRLAWALLSYFDLRKPWTDWIDTYRLGASCARTAGDPHGEAVMMYGLATAYYYPRRFTEALDCYRRALHLHSETGDRRGEGVTLNGIGNVYMETRRYDTALRFYHRSLEIHRLGGYARDEGVVLNNLSETYGKLARYEEAERCARLGLDIQRRVGNRRIEVFTLCHLANARWRLGRQPEAVVLLHEALALAGEVGDQHSSAWASAYLGQIRWEDGQRGAARSDLLRALDLFTDLGDPTAADVRAMLASLDRENQPPAGGLTGLDLDLMLPGPG